MHVFLEKILHKKKIYPISHNLVLSIVQDWDRISVCATANQS